MVNPVHLFRRVTIEVDARCDVFSLVLLQLVGSEIAVALGTDLRATYEGKHFPLPIVPEYLERDSVVFWSRFITAVQLFPWICTLLACYVTYD